MKELITLTVVIVVVSGHRSAKRSVNFCEMGPCLRKCCPKGQYLFNKTCEETHLEFDFSSLGVDPATPVQDGVVQCQENEGRFLLESPYDEFYIEGNNLEWPARNITATFSHYCVDMIENITAPKALFCYAETVQQLLVSNSSGNY